MSNIFGLQCAKCQSGDYLDILVSHYVRLTDDGTDADISHNGDHTWDKSSTCYCDNCGNYGLVSELIEGAG